MTNLIPVNAMRIVLDQEMRMDVVWDLDMVQTMIMRGRPGLVLDLDLVLDLNLI
ncbi:MAG: hypothetical protein WCQ87_10290 [Parabacteroides sp.]